MVIFEKVTVLSMISGIPLQKNQMERRLKLVGLSLEHVVQMDCLFRDVWNIPVMEKIIRERFHGKYPVRKSIQTEFAHVGGKDGLQFQVDAVAYCGE